MNNVNATAGVPSRAKPVSGKRLVPFLPEATLSPQNGEYSLIQLEALAGIALKRATRTLPLSSSWAS